MAFAVGYAVGARAGNEGYDELVASFKAVRDSEEFRGLVTAMRSHAGHVLRELGARLATDADQPITVDEVIARVRNVVRPLPAEDAD
jgi:hypothetical protein